MLMMSLFYTTTLFILLQNYNYLVEARFINKRTILNADHLCIPHHYFVHFSS